MLQDTNDRCAVKLEKVVDYTEWRNIAETAILDLCSLVAGLKSKATLLPKERFAANALMWGIISYSTHMGRSMEWSWMELDHVRKQLKTGKDYIVCKKHKTKDSFGSAGKWIPDAAWKAVKQFLQLPYRLEGKPYALLFEVPNASLSWCEARAAEDHHQVSPASLARAFHRAYVHRRGDHTPLTSQMSRKWITNKSQAHSEKGKFADNIVARANLHGLTCAKLNYACQTAKDHADCVRATTEGIFAEHIAAPFGYAAFRL